MSRDPYASLKQGLVGAWIPSISGSGLLLPDLSMRGNNGVLTNMDASDWVSSSTGRALDFDGVNDLVSISTPGQLQFCVSLWFRIRAFKALSTDGVILAITNGANDNLYIAQRASGSNTLTCNAYDGTVRGIYGTGPALSLNTWTHAVCTAANGLYQIYLNGIKTTETAGSVVTSTTNSITIGNYVDGLRPGDQLIDDVRLYNRALSESEIKLLASDRGIGFKRKRSAFSTRYTYQPPKAKVFEGVRVRDHDYASLRQGLVGAWCPSLPNGGSGNLLVDQSGRGNNGTLTNMGPEDWVASGSGRALDFDGVNDRIDLGTQSLSNSARSVSGWLKLNTLNTNQPILDGSSNAGFGYGLHLRITNNNVIRFWNYDAIFNATGTTAITSGIWYHLCGTFDGTTTNRIYLNGLLEGSSTGDSTNSVSASYHIGASTLLNYFTNGSIDDVRIYSRALTESEIKLLASKRGIGLQPSPTRFIAREKKTGLRRLLLTGQT